MLLLTEFIKIIKVYKRKAILFFTVSYIFDLLPITTHSLTVLIIKTINLVLHEILQL